jgi:membrane protein DedA with SNARE-associated domain
VSGFLQFLESLPPAPLYALIAALAALENFVPPVPADTAVALGAFLAGRGRLDAWAVFGVTWVANVGAGTAVYWLARRFGRPFFRGKFGRRLLSQRTIGHIEQQYQRHGTYGILLSRLLPVWRGVAMPFAGIAGVNPTRALVPLALASALWYGMLTYLVATLGTNLEAALALVTRVNHALAVMAFALLAALGVWAWRRLKR